MVDGLHGIRNESSEFSLASPTKYGYKFQKHEHIEAQIVKSMLHIDVHVYTYIIYILLDLENNPYFGTLTDSKYIVANCTHAALSKFQYLTINNQIYFHR